MAIQLDDKKTGQLIPLPKKRGRPATGEALTPAQKQAAYRERKKKRGIFSIEIDSVQAELLLSVLGSRRNITNKKDKINELDALIEIIRSSSCQTQ